MLSESDGHTIKNSGYLSCKASVGGVRFQDLGMFNCNRLFKIVKKKFKKLGALLAIALLVLMCILCGSRSALIPVVVAFLIFEFSKGKFLFVKYA